MLVDFLPLFLEVAIVVVSDENIKRWKLHILYFYPCVYVNCADITGVALADYGYNSKNGTVLLNNLGNPEVKASTLFVLPDDETSTDVITLYATKE